MSELEKFKLQLRRFAEKRDWEQFHSPKNLSMALSVEVSEIVEHFQWLTEEQSQNLPNGKLEEVETELADTLIYLIRLPTVSKFRARADYLETLPLTTWKMSILPEMPG